MKSSHLLLIYYIHHFAQFCLRLPQHTFRLQMQSLIGKSLIKQAKFICVENIFKLVVGDDRWESCLIPRSGHFRRARFCFSSNRLKRDTVPCFPAIKPAIRTLKIFNLKLFCKENCLLFQQGTTDRNISLPRIHEPLVYRLV